VRGGKVPAVLPPTLFPFGIPFTTYYARKHLPMDCFTYYSHTRQERPYSFFIMVFSYYRYGFVLFNGSVYCVDFSLNIFTWQDDMDLI